MRNEIARNTMRAMKKRDAGFFRHSGGEKAVTGIVSGKPAKDTAIDTLTSRPLKREAG